MEAGGDGEGPLPVLGGDELLERVLQLFVESLHGVASVGGLFCCFHPSIVRFDPVSRVSVALSITLQLRSAGLPNAGRPSEPRSISSVFRALGGDAWSSRQF